ncbi:MAG: Ribose import permease protein RbsC [Phycisphaerae bacterium]|nr:Ribose import permease protein RbsC [Phycisphaerae bacterium]
MVFDSPMQTRSLATRLMQWKEGSLILVIVLLGTVLTVFSEPISIRDRTTGEMRQVNKFLQPTNLDKLVKNTSFIAIMAVGATMIIISGGIDLSIGSTYCLAAVVGAMFFNYFGPKGSMPELSRWLVIPGGMLLCVLTGMICGMINGSLMVLLRVHPFIITLGTMEIFRGIAFVLTKAQAFTFFPPEFTDGLIRREFNGLYPVPLLIMLLVVAGGGIFLTRTIWGRYVYAIGGNEIASRFSGIRVNRIKILVFTIAGLVGGIAAVIMLGYYGAASSDVGTGYELRVIAASVIGGASLTGGKGTALGALLGALIIQMIDNGIVIFGIDQNYSRIIIGSVIVVAVVLDRFSQSVSRRRLLTS